MINRRSILTGTAGTLAATSLGAANTKSAAAVFDIEPRGSDGRNERLQRLDLESVHDYTAGFRIWHRNEVNRTAGRRVLEILRDNGISPNAELSMEDSLALVAEDPIVAMSGRLWLSNQQMMWKYLYESFYAEADRYLEEMESFDNRGPGTLELNPTMRIPDYASHEIHMQPGGYVGDPFSGHAYLYGTDSFYNGGFVGGNHHDQIHRGAADLLPLPGDGKVKRILDLGCGVGQFSVALKERFPDAEVWGLDIGGPMVRYGHMRAADIGVDVNFAQRLASETGFPDNHFDIVTSYIMHHEVPAEISKEIFREAHRVTRPGGYYYPIDFRSGRQASRMTVFGNFRRWWDHRWNNEVHSLSFRSLAFEDEMEKVGLILNPDAKPVVRGFGVRHGIKTT
jgi:ubiquinone/menaquinone biosynthesis C-methylase UbiE